MVMSPLGKGHDRAIDFRRNLPVSSNGHGSICIKRLESFERDGTPVQTPVWFAEDQGVLYIYTLANAGKVKRIRRNPHIRLAPCTMRGTVIGPWVEAEATIVDATTAAHGHALLRQKYGWMKR